MTVTLYQMPVPVLFSGGVNGIRPLHRLTLEDPHST